MVGMLMLQLESLKYSSSASLPKSFSILDFILFFLDSTINSDLGDKGIASP